MKKNSFLIIALALIVSLSACKKDQAGNAGSGNFNRSSSAVLEDLRDIPNTTQVLPNVISASTTLTNDRVWIINGPTFVTNNAILTVQPGTYIKGTKKATSTSKPSFLVITKGAKLVANGTAANPIVFTSNQAANVRTPGDWGGIVLLGNGKTNVATTTAVEGMKDAYMTDLSLPLTTVQYGGTVEADNSGSLSYVRIEFAGDVISEGNELNGLTLGGVGSGTTLDHIQVTYGADDAFEFFGGSANAKFLVSYGNNDDDFDFDQGYQGSIQFAVSVKVPCLTYSTSPNGIESNNITSPVTVVDATRLTRPVLSNFTILGQAASTLATFNSTGTLFRVNSGYKVSNSIVAGFATGASISGGTTTGSFFGYSLVHGFTAATAGTPFTSITSSTAASTNSFLQLVNPFNVNICTTSKPIPDFRYIDDPDAGTSPAASGANFGSISVTFPGGALSAFDTTTYVGAFGSQDSTRWDDNWATYTPKTNPYL